MARHAIPFWVLLPLLPLGTVSVAQDSANRNPKPDDLPLVKKVHEARHEYQASLEALREHYHRQNDIERMRWVEDELLSYHRISKRPYRLELDVPPPNLQPVQNQPEANELFRRAMYYKGRGWLSEHEDNLRRAEILFQQLLSQYPQSDKIADTAYQLGEIYESRAFKQPQRAVAYYERCFQWNPHTSTDARLRAARIFDKVLHDRTKAVSLYREVLNRDTDPKRVEEARRRLTELSSVPRPE